MFRYYKCPEDEKVSLATLEFLDYALSWWTQLELVIKETKKGKLIHGMS